MPPLDRTEKSLIHCTQRLPSLLYIIRMRLRCPLEGSGVGQAICIPKRDRVTDSYQAGPVLKFDVMRGTSGTRPT